MSIDTKDKWTCSDQVPHCSNERPLESSDKMLLSSLIVLFFNAVLYALVISDSLMLELVIPLFFHSLYMVFKSNYQYSKFNINFMFGGWLGYFVFCGIIYFANKLYPVVEISNFNIIYFLAFSIVVSISNSFLRKLTSSIMSFNDKKISSYATIAILFSLALFSFKLFGLDAKFLVFGFCYFLLSMLSGYYFGFFEISDKNDKIAIDVAGSGKTKSDFTDMKDANSSCLNDKRNDFFMDDDFFADEIFPDLIEDPIYSDFTCNIHHVND
ncbi:hypothetical protein FJM67_17250 [Maribrevibacterium harenarium]|uniref:Uncharacterized protein n=1 Tax=Maribrevibacterium harenarium TaxID=2589817 RepID=A0A501W836_9GAMM|nr:hypothetical protein [Maribrevibacterium harenarium]TPE43431.1 hypothetical protein FJM67_17250 [Maribrevibacterium harenarium]